MLCTHSSIDCPMYEGAHQKEKAWNLSCCLQGVISRSAWMLHYQCSMVGGCGSCKAYLMRPEHYTTPHISISLINSGLVGSQGLNRFSRNPRQWLTSKEDSHVRKIKLRQHLIPVELLSSGEISCLVVYRYVAS